MLRLIAKRATAGQMEGVANFRDVGELFNQDAHETYLRPNLFYRSGRLGMLLYVQIEWQKWLRTGSRQCDRQRSTPTQRTIPDTEYLGPAVRGRERATTKRHGLDLSCGGGA